VAVNAVAQPLGDGRSVSYNMTQCLKPGSTSIRKVTDEEITVVASVYQQNNSNFFSPSAGLKLIVIGFEERGDTQSCTPMNCDDCNSMTPAHAKSMRARHRNRIQQVV
jgi:hypothetical protein